MTDETRPLDAAVAAWENLDVEAADAALYKSKEGGRNRLTVADAGCLKPA